MNKEQKVKGLPFVFLMVYSGILSLAILATTIGNKLVKEENLNTIAKGIERSLRTSDLRNMILLLSDSQHVFKRVSFYGGEGLEHFTLPTTADPVIIQSRTISDKILNSVLINEYYFEGNSGNKLGQLVFEYSRFDWIIYSLIFWGFTILITIPAAFRIKKYLEAKYEKETILAQAKLSNKISRQVAHDIRSPLAALNSALENIETLPEDKRILTRRAVNRISEITNDLVDQQGIRTYKKKKEIYLVSSIVDLIVAEKNSIYSHKPNLVIIANFDSKSYGTFTRGFASNIRRAVSNITNNAAEAFTNKQKGTIELKLTKNIERKTISLIIKDNGKGIPTEISDRITEKGFSYNKKQGTGLGLYQAKEVIEANGGTLAITSTINKGTLAEITLPLVPPPSWFAPYIPMVQKATVVILDDDESIHLLWKGRYSSMQVKERKLNLVHFTQADDFVTWHREYHNDDVVYLIDYELIGQGVSGLDLIQQLKLQGNVILVTSRSDELQIQQRCKELNVKLLPKALSHFAPFVDINDENSPEAKTKCLMVDDDELYLTASRMEFERHGHGLKTFKTKADILKYLETSKMPDVVFIDLNIEDDLDGIELAKLISQRDGCKIVLNTGDATINVDDYDFIDSVVIKGDIQSLLAYVKT